MHRVVAMLGAAVGLTLLAQTNALAQNPAQPAPGAAQVNLDATVMAETERVIVTGSNIPTAEEVGPNPVDSYRRDDITRLGVRTPTDFIQRIPAVSGSGLGENNTNPGDGTTRVSLRGIDPKETLVLEDGRRLANVGFAGTSADFNIFPLGLIDHIDILKDGASPVYGTDAVTGVLNVYLIHRFRGLELYASYGNTNLGFANDMAQESAYLLAGSGDDKTNIVVYAGVFNQGDIYSRDVNISHDADKTQWGGGDGRSSKLPGRVGNRAFKGLDAKLFGFDPFLKTPTPHSSANQFDNTQYTTLSSLPPERQRFNFADYTPEIAATDREFLYGSFDRDICDKYLTVFADFTYFRQFWAGALAPSPFDELWTDAAHPFGIGGPNLMSVPTQNAFNPFTVGDYTSAGGVDPHFPQSSSSAAAPGTEFTTGVRFRAVQLGPRTDHILTNNYIFTGGLKGTLGEFANAWDKLKTWEWESAVRWNEDYRIERLGGVVNDNELRLALLDTNPATAFNPFGLNVNSTSVLNRVLATTIHTGWTTLLTEDFKLNGDIFNLAGGPVSFAIGTEHLTTHTFDNPDSLIASGQTGGGVFGSKPTHGTRDSWSQYWEVRIPVTGSTWNFPGAHSLELDYAERFEDYSDFGQTERPKFSVRWQPIDEALTLRATYIEAFHAPALAELFGGQIQSQIFVDDPSTPEGFTEGLFEGNPTLKPEIGYEYTYGGVLTPGKWWSPLQGLTISVDLVHIDLRNYITQFDPQFVLDNSPSIFPTFFGAPGPLTELFVQRDPTSNEIVVINTPFQNAGRFILTNIDYEAVEVFETSRLGHGDWGTLTATFNGTYNADVDLQVVPNGKRFTVVGTFGGGFQGTGGGGNYTHNRWYASLFYDGPSGTWMQGMDTGAAVHYIGQYWDTGAGRKVREWTTLDLIFTYTFNLAPPTAQTQVAGYVKDGGQSAKMSGGKEKNATPVSTAEYNPCGWRTWLKSTTITLGVDNAFDKEPPFVANSIENGFDEVSANAKGRFWYAAVKKRF